jgi:hypothetical protein
MKTFSLLDHDYELLLACIASAREATINGIKLKIWSEEQQTRIKEIIMTTVGQIDQLQNTLIDVTIEGRLTSDKLIITQKALTEIRDYAKIFSSQPFQRITGIVNEALNLSA